jgi:hypothetical protein
MHQVVNVPERAEGPTKVFTLQAGQFTLHNPMHITITALPMVAYIHADGRKEDACATEIR